MCHTKSSLVSPIATAAGLRYPGWGPRPLHVMGWVPLTAQSVAAWQSSSASVHPWNASEAWGWVMAGELHEVSTPMGGGACL